MRDDLQGRLQAYCTRAFPARPGLQVSNLTSITTGWESEMHAIDIEYESNGEPQRESLVLRIYPGDDAYAKSAHEYHSMRHLHRAGYPVPRVLLVERENSPFGRPFLIMERVAGQELCRSCSTHPSTNRKGC